MGSKFGLDNRLQAANQIAAGQSFQKTNIPAGLFSLVSYQRVQNTANKTAHIYIEGDGLAWTSRTRISPNPTPINPMLLRMASMDPADNVIYLARPCQYHETGADRNCRETYWTYKRFAPEIVGSVNAALDRLKSQHGFDQFVLNGFSGGGAIAVLVASKRDDIAGIRTIAGNLDHVAINRHHGVSQMPDSLNPINYVRSVSHIPQVHFSGKQDEIVPSYIAFNFVAKQSEQGCARNIIVETASHHDGWTTAWPHLLQENFPDCH